MRGRCGGWAAGSSGWPPSVAAGRRTPARAPPRAWPAPPGAAAGRGGSAGPGSPRAAAPGGPIRCSGEGSRPRRAGHPTRP
ncbi:MAG: hypothetical protein E6I36_09250 [Chloroflexi bacterium]|nr:MAG: hypothetical protein E6I36_09250 [Chloroflexota bacterium]